jgi:hypothetical protein
VGEVVDNSNNSMGGNGSVVGPLIADPQADNANRATIILFIVLPFS